MTTVAVLCDPPRDDLVLPELPATSPLTASEATTLYTAMLKDVCAAVEASGGDLLVNYRPEDALPDHESGAADGGNAKEEIKTAIAGALSEPESVRFERQVGQTFSGRAGNTATHLLEREEADSAAIVTPYTPFLSRQQIDTAAMKLRRSPVVLGPAPGGRVYYAGFTSTIDYADSYETPAVETLTDRAIDAGHEVDFLDMNPFLATGSDLVDIVALLRARRTAGRIIPEHTTTAIETVGLSTDGTNLQRSDDR
ncbi:hypothetical protein [Halocatena pleomorpha]|uniref:DUF2064 domain-containing protein n=1 Tax=Halocatena pleomorpha TaxID=1785090 RepID=A0A3P3R8I3_9EURY|nr:hypothetical protein [Halocatena pleomorpha]RRJ29781.1 hypothetical protein EIK79_11870 [Halocatena pleomorpha]